MTEILSKGERTAQIIAEVAYSLFVQQGFHATSMRQIAQGADVALGSIYNHFKSKEEIFDYVLLEKHPYHHILTVLAATPGSSMDEFLNNTVAAIAVELNQHPDFLKLVFIELSEFKGRHAPHLFQTIFPLFAPLFQRFNGAGGQLRDLPSEAIGLAFMGLLFSYYLTCSAGIHNTAAHPITPEHFIDIFLHGILNPEKP